MRVQRKAAPSGSFTPARTGLLQRKCACGGSIGPGGECTTCRQESSGLQGARVGENAPPAFSTNLGLNVGQAQVPRTASERIQTKLTVNQPGDKYEQEADRVADRVMRMPEPHLQRQVEPLEDEQEEVRMKPLPSAGSIQRQPMEEEEEELQAKELPGRAAVVSPRTQAYVTALRGGGQPLPESVRSSFEPRFGYDFSGVRVHTDAKAAESAKAISARAYTRGRDIVFGAGQYNTSTDAGKRLLAHELTHTV